MKKNLLYKILLLSIILSNTPFFNVRGAVPAPLTKTASPASEAPDVLLLRLQEIKKIDKSTIDATERKKLRKEVKLLKIRAKQGNGGIYLSVGALIIIILLLIILL